jgi:hypothetical protein
MKTEKELKNRLALAYFMIAISILLLGLSII